MPCDDLNFDVFRTASLPAESVRDAVPSMVHIVDDDADMCRLLELLISRAGYKTAVHQSAQDVLDDPELHRCDCLIVDYYLPEMTGLELQDRLRSAGSHVPFVVVTGNGDVTAAVESMRRGACGFLEKPFSSPELLGLVRRAVRLHREWVAVQVKLDSLSAREREVLSYVAAGELSKQIALRLDISPRTVEVHRSHIMKKLGMRSVAQLVHTLTRHLMREEHA